MKFVPTSYVEIFRTENWLLRGKYVLMTTLKSVEQEWQDFAARVIPQLKPGQVQFDEMKKAFFAGVFALQSALVEIGQTHVSEDEGVAYLESIRIECTRFAASLTIGAGSRGDA